MLLYTALLWIQMWVTVVQHKQLKYQGAFHAVCPSFSRFVKKSLIIYGQFISTNVYLSHIFKYIVTDACLYRHIEDKINDNH